MLLQERADLNELDFVTTLGPVPPEARAAVFTELLSANFYWQETFGATLSWNADLGEVVLIYPLQLAGVTAESLETVFTRFIDLQAVWLERFAAMTAGAKDSAPGGGGEDGEDPEDAEDNGDDDGDGKDLIINP